MPPKVLKAALVLLSLITFWVASTAIFGFFGIGFAAYGNYLFWGVALTLFYYVLQPNPPSLFSGDS